MKLDWRTYAGKLADSLDLPSTWHSAIAGMQRPQFVPCWWAWSDWNGLLNRAKQQWQEYSTSSANVHPRMTGCNNLPAIEKRFYMESLKLWIEVCRARAQTDADVHSCGTDRGSDPVATRGYAPFGC